MPNLRDLLADVLARHDIPRLEAELLLAHALQRDRAWLFAHADATPDAAHVAAFESLLARRDAGEPIAYLTGRRGFWSLDLEVTPATLIPRPETELLVELALERIPADFETTASATGSGFSSYNTGIGRGDSNGSDSDSSGDGSDRDRDGGDGGGGGVADLGTGSGAVALAIASERPHVRVVATDASAAALAVAQRNARRLGLANVRFVEGDWCTALGSESFAVIVSNPPYIEQGDAHLGQGDLRHEPRAALASGIDGLDAIRRIVRDARPHLQPGGWLLLEHGWTQAAAVRDLLQQHGYTDILTAQDLESRDRVTAARR